MPKLHELAHCRAGDKGDTSILSLIAYRDEDYALLVEQVTVEAVAAHLEGIVLGEIRRYELPALWALQFVCERALGGGVTTSLALDAHGKSLSYALLEMEIQADVNFRSSHDYPTIAREAASKPVPEET